MSDSINTFYEDEIDVDDTLKILPNIINNIESNNIESNIEKKNDNNDEFENKILKFIYNHNYKQYFLFLLTLINMCLLIFLIFYISTVVNKAHEFADYVLSMNKTKIKDYIHKIEYIIDYGCDNIFNCNSSKTSISLNKSFYNQNFNYF